MGHGRGRPRGHWAGHAAGTSPLRGGASHLASKFARRAHIYIHIRLRIHICVCARSRVHACAHVCVYVCLGLRAYRHLYMMHMYRSARCLCTRKASARHSLQRLQSIEHVFIYSYVFICTLVQTFISISLLSLTILQSQEIHSYTYINIYIPARAAMRISGLSLSATGSPLRHSLQRLQGIEHVRRAVYP